MFKNILKNKYLNALIVLHFLLKLDYVHSLRIRPSHESCGTGFKYLSASVLQVQ